MMAQTPKKTPAKGKGRTTPAGKGCTCKWSQCIKNYCDCYQTTMICTQFCRCVGELSPMTLLSGCRRAEERMAAEPRTAPRNSNAIKRDRAAPMSAKVWELPFRSTENKICVDRQDAC